MLDTLQLSKYNVHDTLLELTNNIIETDVGVALSSGIDSMSVLLSLLECSKNVTIYSFTLENYESRDYLVAKDIANKLDLQFVPVFLPVDLIVLKKDILIMAKKYECRKKTDFECFWPYLYMMKQVQENVIATGMAADGYFAISKKGSIHYKNDIQSFRKQYFSNANRCQLIQRTKLAKELNKKLFDPYLSTEMYNLLYESTWEECNRPHQKMPIRMAFNYEKYMKIYPHTNFQLGDSKISEHFKKLLDSDWNRKNYKSTTGIFNAVVRGELDDKRKLI